MRASFSSEPSRRVRGVLPSPLWGGVGGGGRAILAQVAPSSSHRITPLPSPPPQGGREQTSARGGGSSRSFPCAAAAARAARRMARQRQKAVQLGEQQRADVELGEEDAALDQARDLRRRDEFHADARLRLERAHALAGLDEEIVDAVVEAAGAGGVLAQRVNGARGEAGLF